MSERGERKVARATAEVCEPTHTRAVLGIPAVRPEPGSARQISGAAVVVGPPKAARPAVAASGLLARYATLPRDDSPAVVDGKAGEPTSAPPSHEVATSEPDGDPFLADLAASITRQLDESDASGTDRVSPTCEVLPPRVETTGPARSEARCRSLEPGSREHFQFDGLRHRLESASQSELLEVLAMVARALWHGGRAELLLSLLQSSLGEVDAELQRHVRTASADWQLKVALRVANADSIAQVLEE